MALMHPHGPMNAPTEPPRRPSLMEALGIAHANAAVGTAAAGGAAAVSGASSGTGLASAGAGAAGAGAAGAAGEDAAAGLGVDEFIDPLVGTGAKAGTGAGREGSSLTNLRHLPGNALNMVEMFQLRERNHVFAQNSARRSGDRRSVQLDVVGLELLRQIQRKVERAHFSQAAVSTRGKPKAVSDQRFADTRAEGITPRKDEPRLELRHQDAPPPDEETPPLDLDPDRPMASVAREHAAFQREVLLVRCADAHAQALSDLAELNQAEAHADELRGRRSEQPAEASPQDDSASELLADGAEQFEAVARQRLGASNARAVQLAAAVQGRRIGVPVRSMQGYRDLGTVEDYLSEEFHTSIGPELQRLLCIARDEELTPTILVRAHAIMHNDGTIDAMHAVKQSFDWGFTMLRAGVLERYRFGISPLLGMRQSP